MGMVVGGAEAAGGQPWVTSLNHLLVALPPFAAVPFPHLDGSKDCQDLKALLADAVTQGKVDIPEFKAANALPDSITTHELDNTLAHLARHALLEP